MATARGGAACRNPLDSQPSRISHLRAAQETERKNTVGSTAAIDSLRKDANKIPRKNYLAILSTGKVRAELMARSLPLGSKKTA